MHIHEPTPDTGQYSHFLLTRFNVRSFYHYAEPTDEWLRERLDLFLRYCLPSVAGQTSRSFRWLVFFDSQTPAWFRAEIEKWTSHFEPVYVDGAFDGRVVAAEVKARAVGEHVITSRLDNDDAVARDFIEVIQSSFRGQELEFINLTTGSQYAQGRFYLRPYTKNPFLSLIERNTPRLKTAFVEHHYQIDLAGPVHNVRTGHPLWLQVIHGGNVLNEIVGLRVPSAYVTAHFSCTLPGTDRPVDLVAGMISSAARIGLRLLRGPHRIAELARTIKARVPADHH